MTAKRKRISKRVAKKMSMELFKKEQTEDIEYFMDITDFINWFYLCKSAKKDQKIDKLQTKLC